MKMSFRPRMIWYYVRSFFRRRWTLDDYPVVIRFHPDGTAAPDEDGTWLPPYTAAISGIILAGFGVSADAARADLYAKFEEFRKDNPLPRPGTSQPIQFAATDRIEAFGALRDDFVARVLQMEWAFISDGSTLEDFPEPEELNRRIMLLYGVDADRLPDRRIVTILDAIQRR